MRRAAAAPVTGLVLVASAALAALAATTRPFTLAADAVVTVGFAGLVAVLVMQWRHRPEPPLIARRSGPSPTPRWGRRLALWVVPVAAAVGWELFNYLETPRAAHPTVSSMLDAVDATHVGHGLVFAGWLALGWYLVTR